MYLCITLWKLLKLHNLLNYTVEWVPSKAYFKTFSIPQSLRIIINNIVRKTSLADWCMQIPPFLFLFFTIYFLTVWFLCSHFSMWPRLEYPGHTDRDTKNILYMCQLTSLCSVCNTGISAAPYSRMKLSCSYRYMPAIFLYTQKKRHDVKPPNMLSFCSLKICLSKLFHLKIPLSDDF